ncbi:hypothetical protein F5Y15DRAFT_285940 [Xylariaceae sp. FL0016]|nr:hypothetical protein F5Y15DRAFT_285940 [Xylariaceae sp. FL0016]
MDDLDPGLSWPAWKFGMKRADLSNKLHDQYNTLTFPIQDLEAFHHDVCEISHAASTADEFHRLLDQRKQLRMRELEDGLQSASLEIIANPKLIGTQQWQHALQLFRTRSFDSLVRYFASYLPDDSRWSCRAADSDCKPFFDPFDEDIPILTHEPLSISTKSHTSLPASHLPPSPRSLTTCSDSSSASTPARGMSFSELECDDMALSGTLAYPYDDEEETSQSDDPDTPTTSVSDLSDIHHSGCLHKKGDADDISTTTHHTHLDAVEELADDSTTPTPRTESASYLANEDTAPTIAASSIPSSKYSILQKSIRNRSPELTRTRRRSPEIGRVQKPLPDPMRSRPRGKRR